MMFRVFPVAYRYTSDPNKESGSKNDDEVARQRPRNRYTTSITTSNVIGIVSFKG